MRPDLTAALTAALALPALAAEPPMMAKTEAPAEAAGTRYDLLVVGVYRPLDLEGRFIVEPREVYLQSIGVPDGPLSTLIGRTLEVVRQVPVPASVPMLDPEAPAAASQPASAPTRAEPETPGAVPTRTVPTPVGRLEVTAIRGEVVVARVLEDGVGPTETMVGGMAPEAVPSRVDVPAVMAGDVARYVEPPPPIPPPPPLTAEEKARLEAEQRRLEQDDARRKARPKPYERPVMRWRL